MAADPQLVEASNKVAASFITTAGPIILIGGIIGIIIALIRRNTGDAVTAGQTLGKAARENNGMYRYELQINKDVNGVTTFHCSTDLLRADVKATQTAAIEQFITDWKALYGSNIYGSDASACAQPVLTLAETD